MTWFELEQIARFISDLEAALDEWRLNNIQMREKKAELDRMADRLRHYQRPGGGPVSDGLLSRAVNDLNEHIRLCRRDISQRLIS